MVYTTVAVDLSWICDVPLYLTTQFPQRIFSLVLFIAFAVTAIAGSFFDLVFTPAVQNEVLSVMPGLLAMGCA